jgi:hypothetical protein
LGLAAALVLAAGGCSSQRLVVVDPPPAVMSTDASDAPADVQVVIPPGLLDNVVGYWRLDDGVGSVTARDSSGRGNNGVLVGLSSATAWTAGRSGGGLGVNGNGWVVVTPSASVDAISDQLTVSGWVYLDGTISNFGTLISREIGSTIEQHYHLSLTMDRHPNLFITTVNKTVILTAPDVVAMRTWVHVAGTYDGQSARLYLNGVPGPAMPITGALASDTTPLILGGNGNDATDVPIELFPGRIDEVMLYRRALTDEEILRVYNGELFTTGATDRDAATD